MQYECHWEKETGCAGGQAGICEDTCTRVVSSVFMAEKKKDEIQRERARNTWCRNAAVAVEMIAAHLGKQMLHIQIPLQCDYSNELLKRV